MTDDIDAPMTELHPGCRYCGGSGAAYGGRVLGKTFWNVVCQNAECGAHGPRRATADEAIAAWSSPQANQDSAISTCADRANVAKATFLFLEEHGWPKEGGADDAISSLTDLLDETDREFVAGLAAGSPF